MKLPPPPRRPSFFPKKRQPETTSNPESPQPKGGRFKVTIEPHLRDGNKEWWAKLDDNGEQVSFVSYHDRDIAERRIRNAIERIKSRELHESQAGVSFETD